MPWQIAGGRWVPWRGFAWSPHLAPRLHLLAQELDQGLVAVRGQHRLVPQPHLQLQRAQAASVPAGAQGGWGDGGMDAGMEKYFTKQDVAQQPGKAWPGRWGCPALTPRSQTRAVQGAAPPKGMMLPRNNPLPSATVGTGTTPGTPQQPHAETHSSSLGLDLSGRSPNQPSSCPAASSPWTLNTTWEGMAGGGRAGSRAEPPHQQR